MGHEFMYEFEEAIEFGLIPAILSSVPSLAVTIGTYVLTALALYQVAERRGLKNPWLAWIPVANLWILGSISDQYRYVTKREYRSKRKILLVLSILGAVCTVALTVLGIVTAVGAVTGVMQFASEERMLEMILGPTIGILGLSVPMAGIAIARAIVRYMALYDVYMSMDPRNGVMYLVLSIIFNITEPFFLFFNRHRDEGMPPRKRQEAPKQEQPQWQPPEAPQEPWEQSETDYL